MASLYFWYRGYNMFSQAKPVGIMLFWKREHHQSSWGKANTSGPLQSNVEKLTLPTSPGRKQIEGGPAGLKAEDETD